MFQTPSDPLLSTFLTRPSFPPFSLVKILPFLSTVSFSLGSISRSPLIYRLRTRLLPFSSCFRSCLKKILWKNPEAHVSKTAVSNIVPNHKFRPCLQEDTSQMSTLMAVWGALGLAGAFVAVVPPLCAATSVCQTLVNEALEPWHAAGAPQGSPLSNFVLALGLLGGVPLASAAGEGYPSYI
jgi:hypothetical protein